MDDYQMGEDYEAPMDDGAQNWNGTFNIDAFVQGDDDEAFHMKEG
jgi:hypothetical protein